MTALARVPFDATVLEARGLAQEHPVALFRMDTRCRCHRHHRSHDTCDYRCSHVSILSYPPRHERADGTTLDREKTAHGRASPARRQELSLARHLGVFNSAK